MRQNTTSINQEEWLKILGKGMITLPKKWRDELGIESGNMVKAKKEGDKVIIQAQKSASVPYRVYSDAEIEEFLGEDKIDETLVEKLKMKFA
ncbi:MAG: hypothetical protein UR81_C0005G0009 [Candidatus Levybacteria bacterium GW2011_GWB1_35_5]|nr:MAG: hypothetical protein UR81_C0005G0009 [Candidatus Levybacteria bacterium GW2011_GWB1_35_5]